LGGTKQKPSDTYEEGTEKMEPGSSWWEEDNRCKLKQQWFRQHVRQNFFTRTVKDWTRMLRDPEPPPSLEVFKTRLGKALSNMSCPCFKQDIGPENFQGPLQPELPYDPMIL